MKAISTWQPYGSLLVSGLKAIETRSWDAKYHGWIAVIATKGGLPLSEFARLMRTEPFLSAISKLGYKSIADFPSGLIGAVRLGPCVKVLHAPRVAQFYGGEVTIPPRDPELSFGDYTPGRFGWITVDRVACKKPVPWNGGLRWVTVPDDVVWEACGGRPANRLVGT